MVRYLILFLAMTISMCQARSFAATYYNNVPNINYNQSMGLINIPTANLLKHGEYRLSTNAAIFSFGLLDFFEFGALGFTENHKFYYGDRLTIKLIEEDAQFPGIAIGAENFMETPCLREINAYTSYFVVVSRNLGDDLILHAGIGTGRFVGGGLASSQLHGFFMGIEKTYISWWGTIYILKLEEDGRNVNIGAKFLLSPSLSLAISAYDLDNGIYQHLDPENDPKVSVGVTYDIYYDPPRGTLEGVR
jgi:hypothetical protein